MGRRRIQRFGNYCEAWEDFPVRDVHGETAACADCPVYAAWPDASHGAIQRRYAIRPLFLEPQQRQQPLLVHRESNQTRCCVLHGKRGVDGAARTAVDDLYDRHWGGAQDHRHRPATAIAAPCVFAFGPRVFAVRAREIAAATDGTIIAACVFASAPASPPLQLTAMSVHQIGLLDHMGRESLLSCLITRAVTDTGRQQQGVALRMGMSTKLATHQDIDQVIHEQKPPHQPPELPQFQAKDLHVPKGYIQAVNSENSGLWTDSMDREYG